MSNFQTLLTFSFLLYIMYLYQNVHHKHCNWKVWEVVWAFGEHKQEKEYSWLEQSLECGIESPCVHTA